MMERFIIFSALIVAALAGPIQQFSVGSETTCSKACVASDKFQYIPGKTYEFHYDSEVRTSVQGSSEDHAGVHMSATVHIEVLSKCDLVMRLSDVSLEEYDPIDLVMKKQAPGAFDEELEKYPLRISFQDGYVEELCLVAEEPQWVMNVKRGILSVFQNNFIEGQENSTLRETDIAGNCATEYTTGESGWYSKTIKKSKNLLSCTERNGYNTVIQGVPYSADSAIQSLPIVRSTHECEHQIDKQSFHLTSATCREQHMFRPFSRSDSGAVTHSTQKLKLIHVSLGTRPIEPVVKKTSLRFDHIDEENQETNTRKELERKLMEICEGTKNGVDSNTPRLFSDLVYIVRSVNSRTLSETYQRIKSDAVCSESKERVSKFLLDSLPIAGTSASLSMMTDLLTKKVVTGLEASMWLTSLAFIKNPTQDMLSQVKPLLSMEDNEEKALLSVGSLIHSYCTSSGVCDQDTVVKKMIAAIENKIAKGCKVARGDFKSTLIALRAIGNAGFSYSAIPTLHACMKIADNPIEIRLSAIEAFRRMPCDADKVNIMSIFLDTSEDSEIRIAAYKALMECPSIAVIDRVKKTLETEEINQVGSYVWSHLTNLMETSDRHKQYIREILEDEQLKKEFNLDKRKFSRNYEGSFFIEKLNTGAKVEGDLIWSQKSFIPRSAMFNLTVDLFGHSVNLLELGGRAEGLEIFMEKFFGPNGYFSENTADDTEGDISNSKSLSTSKMKKIESRYRPKLDDLKASMYMRVFGNELRYMNFHGLEPLLSGPDINFLEMFMQLSKDNDYTMTHSTMFLDSSMIIPTGSGFPMNLTVNGTATVDLRLKGKMDLRNLPSIDIDGLIQPSAAIDISSMMSVDAYVTNSGIKMISTMNTNTAVMGKLKVDGDGVVLAEYEMPQPRMDIISVKSSFFTIHNDLEKEQKMISENQQTRTLCSSDQLVTITGLELCAELQYPNASQKSDAPYFPMTGPVTGGIFLYNRDTHRKYKMEARSLHNDKKNILFFSFDTPESKISRHVAVDINLDKTAQTLDMTLNSPWKKANFQGVLIWDKLLQGVTGKMNIDGSTAYSIDAQLKKEREKNAHKYSPTLEITLPNKQPYRISGMFMYDGNRQFDVEFDMNRITQKPIKASGTLFNKPNLLGIKGNLVLGDKEEYSVDISNAIKAYKQKTIYKPFISIRRPAGEVVAFGGTAQNVYGKKLAYNFVLDKIVDKKVTLKGFVQKLVRKRNRVLYRNRLNFASSPLDLAVDAKLDNRNYRTIATDIDLSYVIRRVARNNIKMVSKISNLSSRALLKGKSALLFTVKRNPELNVKMIGNVDHNAKHTEADLDVRYGEDFNDENKHIDFVLNSDRQIKSLYDATADGQIRLRHLGQGLSMVLKGNHKHDTSSLESSIYMRLGKGDPFESTVRLSDKTTKLLDVSGEFTLSYPGREIVINETIKQPEDQKYVSIFNGQLQKGQKNSVIISVTRTSENGGRLDADVHIQKDTPYHVDAELNLLPSEFFTRASYQKGAERYAGSLTYVNVTNLYRLVTDIELPERHIKLALDGKPTADLWSGAAELKWDADKDNSQGISVTGWLEPVNTATRVNGSVTLTYPQRTLTLNAHNIIGTKVTSHADFSWERNKQIDIDFIYGSGDNSGNQQIISKAKLTTPFAMIPMVSVDLTHTDASEEYKTEVDLRWLRESISTTTIIRKPLSFRTIVGSVETQTSFKAARKVKFEMNHKLSDSLASVAKLSWNRMFVQTEIVLLNQTKGKKVSYTGDVDIKTSFSVMKKGTLTLSHNNNGITFITNADFLRNRQKYGFTSQITHQMRESHIDNAGTITLYCPHGNSETVWSHRNSKSDIATVFSTKWGDGKKFTNEVILKTFGNMIFKQYSGSVNGSIELLTPFSNVGDIQVQLSHSHDGMDRWSQHTFIDSSFRIHQNRNPIASIEVLRQAQSRKLTSYLVVKIPDLDVDSSIKINAEDPPRSEKEDAFINFDVVITPSVSASLLLKAMLDDSFHSAIEFKSSFPEYRQFRYTYDAVIDKFMNEHQLSVVRQLHYGDGKMIEVETKLVLDSVIKRGLIGIKTPYDSLQKFEGNIVFIADRDFESFTWDSYLEILPYFEKSSQSVMWNTSQGLQSRLRIDTPFRNLSFFEATVNYKDDADLMQATAGLDYGSDILPRYPIYIEVTNDRSDGSIYDLSAKMSAPLTIELSHRGSREGFRCKADLGLESGTKDYGLQAEFSMQNKIQGSLTVSLPSRRDIRGYFTHLGTGTSFATHAEILHNRKNRFLSDLSFNNQGDLSVSGSVSLISNVLFSEEQFEAEFHHEGWLQNFKSHAEFATSSLGKSETDVSFDMRNDIDGSFSLKSSLSKNIISSFNLHTKDDYLQARADCRYGGRKLIDFLTTLDITDSFTGEVSLTNPFTKDIQAKVRVNGKLESFTLKSEGSYGSFSSEADLSSSFGPGYIRETLIVKATGMHDVSVEINYDGLKDSMRSVAEINIEGLQHRVEASFSNISGIEGSFSISSALVRPVSSRFIFQGVRTNFISHAELNLGLDKNEVDTSFSMSPQLQGSFSLRTPYWTDISAEFDHTGTFPNVQSQAKLGYAGKDQLKIVTSMSTEGKISGSIDVDTSFKDIENLHLAFSHEGGLQNFRCHAETVVNGNKAEADVFYSSLERIEGLASLKSYLFQDLSLGFKHSGTLKSFKSHAEYTLGFVKTEGDVSLDIGDTVDASVRLRSPNIDEVQVTYSHKGTLSDLSCHVIYTHGSSKKEMTLSFRNRDSPKLDFRISAPELTLNLNHAGYITDFRTHGDMIFEDEKRIADISLTINNKVNGSVTITAPMFSLKVSLDGDLLNFVSNIELVKDYDRYASEARLSTISGIEASILLNSPVEGYENIKAQYTHDGSFKQLNFKCHGELAMPDSLSVADLTVNLETAVEGSFALLSPLVPDINAEFGHSRTKTSYKSHAEVSVDHDVMVGVIISLDHSSGLEGEFHLQTPFKGYRNIRSSGRYTGNLRSFSLHQEVLLGTDRHEVDVTFNSESNYTGSFSVRTPLFPEIDADFNYVGKSSFSLDRDLDASFVLNFLDRDDISGKLTHAMRSQGVNTHVEVQLDSTKKYELDSIINWRKAAEAKFNLKTPVEGYEDNSFTLSHSGEFPNMKSSAKLTYPNNEISLSTELSHADSTTGNMKIILPIEDWDLIDVTFFREGSLPYVKAGMKIDYTTGKEIEVTVEHNKIVNTEGYRLYLKSPFTEKIDLSFNHTGGASFNFENNFVLTVGQDIRFRIDNNLKTGPEYVSYLYTSEAIMSGETFTEKISFNHHGNINHFRTDALVSFLDKFVQLETSFQNEPVVEGSVSLKSSFEAVKDMKARFSHTENEHGFTSAGELQYSPKDHIEGKVDFSNHGWRRMVTEIELRTPFKDYSFNRIAFEHKGESDSFQCDGEILVGNRKMTGAFSGSKSPWSLAINIHTPFKDFEKLAFNGNIDIDGRGRYSGRIETSWNLSELVVINGLFSTLNENQLIDVQLYVSSPFEQLHKLAVDFSHRQLSEKYIESLKVNYNGMSLVDIELDDSLLQARRKSALTVRSPRPMKFEVDGEFSLYSVNTELTASWNSDDPASNLHIVASYDFKPTVSEKMVSLKVTSQGQMISYSGSLNLDDWHSKSDLAWGKKADQKIGYELTLSTSSSRAKLVLPTRSIEVTGSRRERITEGSIKWDADNDQTKKVAFRSVIVPSPDSVKADLTLMLPSLGKNVQVDSEMVMNRGRVIFDAKTEFTYSPDSRKKLVITSKLEDISSRGSKNYSFSLGLNHPYSTIGIQMDSHVGKSDNDVTGSLGLEYLTVRRQMKTFHVSGQIHKLRKSVSFELVSPIKTISISGSAQTNNKFQVSLLNVYDQRQPLNTVFTLDREKRTVSLTMNYDLDAPSDELHVTAGYVNSSALAAEIFRVTRRVKVTDALIATRLNNSQLLHNRLHWRPELLDDLQTYMERKSASYRQRLSKARDTVIAEINTETSYKLPLIYESLEDLIGKEEMRKIDEVMTPVLTNILDHINDVTDDVIRILAENVRRIANRTSIAYQGMNPVEKISGAFNGMGSVENVLKYTRVLNLANQPLSSQANYIVNMFRDPVKNIPSQVGNALKYTADGVLPAAVSQHLSNANHYWEWEDNVISLTETLLQWAEEETINKLRSLEQDLLKTLPVPYYIYDPVHGEIQVDFHLPIPLKSLDSLPEVPDLNNFVLARNMRNLIDMVPVLGQLNRYVPDFSGELVPPFSATASIQNGHKITTFDGYDYNLPLDCTFILAKDFIDGNFSLILSNDRETSLTVISKGKEVRVKLSEEVKVDGTSVELPYYYKNLRVTSPEDGVITVDSANSFTVTWDTAEDHIVVTLSGWYHGRTGGLLGVYDNEPSNDLMTPFGKTVDNERRFSMTWDVGKEQCH